MAYLESYIVTFVFGKNYSTVGQDRKLFKYSLPSRRRMKRDGEDVSPLGGQLTMEDEVVFVAAGNGGDIL